MVMTDNLKALEMLKSMQELLFAIEHNDLRKILISTNNIEKNLNQFKTIFNSNLENTRLYN